MNEQEQTSQLSALFDGELPSQQAEMVIRRALRDSTMRDRWQRYALIGACVRGEPLAAPGRDSIADRVGARLASEADILAPASGFSQAGAARAGGRARYLGRGAMGGAIAAGVAVATVFLVRSMAPLGEGPAALVAEQAVAPAAPELVVAQQQPAAGEAAPRSYTTPVQAAPAANLMVDQQPLAHYVVAHSEQAASSFGFSYDLTQGAVDMTEDEIAAHR